MPHPFGDDEPLTVKRVQYRLDAIIQAMPTSAKEIVSDRILIDIRADMVRIAAALEYLRQVGRIID